MNEFRITLISDATDEFPNNKNNYKVRLPTILRHLASEFMECLRG